MNNTTNSNNFATKSVSNADYLTQPCTFWFVYLSASLEPILGTMHLKHNNSYDANATPCTEARLTNYQMVPPAGHVQCFFKSGFRYFYQVDQQKRIVPNSMIQVPKQGKPPMCVGNHSYLEFINWTPAPNPTD